MDMLKVETEAAEQIWWHAERSYPHEAICVVGSVDDVVRLALPLVNHAKRSAVTLVRRYDLAAAEAELARRDRA